MKKRNARKRPAGYLAAALRLYHDFGITLRFGRSFTGIAHYDIRKHEVVLDGRYFPGRRANAANAKYLTTVLLHELGHVLDFQMNRYPAQMRMLRLADQRKQPTDAEFHAFLKELPPMELSADRFARDMAKKLGFTAAAQFYLPYYQRHGWAKYFDRVLDVYGFERISRPVERPRLHRHRLKPPRAAHRGMCAESRPRACELLDDEWTDPAGVDLRSYAVSLQ